MISGGFLDRRDWVHPPIQRYWLLQSRHLIVCSMWPRCVTCVILLHQKAAGSQLTLAPIGAPTTLRRRLKQRNYSRPNGVTIRSQGTKAPVRTLVAQDRRSPSTTRRMSRTAKGFLLPGPLFSETSARADSQKRRSPVPFRIASRARRACGRGGRQCWCFLTRMRLRYAQPH
jgi:hypothetical protein